MGNFPHKKFRESPFPGLSYPHFTPHFTPTFTPTWIGKGFQRNGRGSPFHVSPPSATRAIKVGRCHPGVCTQSNQDPNPRTEGVGTLPSPRGFLIRILPWGPLIENRGRTWEPWDPPNRPKGNNSFRRTLAFFLLATPAPGQPEGSAPKPPLPTRPW